MLHRLIMAILALFLWSSPARAQTLSFYADFTARFDNPGGGYYQRIFDYGNGPGNSNIWLGQVWNSTDMRFEVWNGNVNNGITATNAIVSGETATWTATVTSTGYMQIRKNGLVVAQGQGLVPQSVSGGFLLVGQSHWSADTPLIGSATNNAFDRNPQPITCPTGSTATGSGYASSGNGANRQTIFWLDWSCGSRTIFPLGYTVNKQWTFDTGVTVTGQITSLTEDIDVYSTNGTEQLSVNYAGVNPIGLRNRFTGTDPQFRLTLSAAINGQLASMSYIVAEAQELGGATANEALVIVTTGSAWTLLETLGTVTTSLVGQTATMSDPPNAAPGTALVRTNGQTVNLDTTVRSDTGRRSAAAFGILTPFDGGDARFTGTNYGNAQHKTTFGNFGIGAGVTVEANSFDTVAANGDVDDGISTWPALFRSQQTNLSVPVLGLGYLHTWIDFNADGDFADSGEQVAANVQDGGTGDIDATLNGTIVLAITPPAGAVTTATIARLRYSAATNTTSSGAGGLGEVEDYQITIVFPNLTVTKTSQLISDPINASNPKAIPGATIRYCVTMTNNGSASADSIVLTETVPPTMTLQAATPRIGADCVTANSTAGVSTSGATITANIASLAIAQSTTLTFLANIN